MRQHRSGHGLADLIRRAGVGEVGRPGCGILESRRGHDAVLVDVGQARRGVKDAHPQGVGGADQR